MVSCMSNFNVGIFLCYIYRCYGALNESPKLLITVSSWLSVLAYFPYTHDIKYNKYFQFAVLLGVIFVIELAGKLNYSMAIAIGGSLHTGF